MYITCPVDLAFTLMAVHDMVECRPGAPPQKAITFCAGMGCWTLTRRTRQESLSQRVQCLSSAQTNA